MGCLGQMYQWVQKDWNHWWRAHLLVSFLGGWTLLLLVSDILLNRSSNKSHKPEVLDPARYVAKQPQASFSSGAALALSVAESCSINKD